MFALVVGLIYLCVFGLVWSAVLVFCNLFGFWLCSLVVGYLYLGFGF